MKLPSRLAVFLLCFVLASTSGMAADAPGNNNDKTPGAELVALVTQVTGIAISPLLGVSAVGAYHYFKADTREEKARLPWFAHPAVWCVGALVVVGCALKDALGAAVPPGLKKPLDVLELAENKLSGLVATGAVIPLLVSVASREFAGLDAAVVSEPIATGLAMIQLGFIDFSWLLTLAMLPLAIVVFVIVWVTSHALNVLILLSPWGPVDAALKGARTAVLGLVTATAYIDPVVGVTVSAAIIVVSYFCAGWAFRLTVFGTVFTWDFLTLRRHRFVPAENGNRVFTSRAIGDAPIRTYGRLLRCDDGSLQLAYRPWLLLTERTTALPTEGLAVGRGLFWPTVEFPEGEKNRTLLTLPPRYKGHEPAFAAAYGIGELRDVGLRRGWVVLKDLFGFGRPRVRVETAAPGCAG